MSAKTLDVEDKPTTSDSLAMEGKVLWRFQ
jgi:hypothetical protein